MGLSYITYTADGSTTDFTVTFPYISPSHVRLSVEREDVPFTWVNATTVRAAVTPGVSDVVRIYRDTPVTQLVDFTHGARLSEEDLDIWTRQLLYICQEVIEGRGLTYPEGIFVLAQDTSPVLGGDLTLNGFKVGPATYDELDNITGSTGNLQEQIDSLAHSDILDDEPEKHRQINDGGTGATVLWSADKIATELAGRSASSHNHDHEALTNVIASKHRMVLYGSDAAPSPTGLADGTIYLKHEA
jgi:hypothetical protein